MLTRAVDNVIHIACKNLTASPLTVGLFVDQDADISLGEMKTFCERKEMNTLTPPAVMSEIVD